MQYKYCFSPLDVALVRLSEGTKSKEVKKKAEDTQDDAQGTQSSSSQDVNVYDVIARVSGTNERTNSDVITPPPPPPPTSRSLPRRLASPRGRRRWAETTENHS